MNPRSPQLHCKRCIIAHSFIISIEECLLTLLFLLHLKSIYISSVYLCVNKYLVSLCLSPILSCLSLSLVSYLVLSFIISVFSCLSLSYLSSCRSSCLSLSYLSSCLSSCLGLSCLLSCLIPPLILSPLLAYLPSCLVLSCLVSHLPLPSCLSSHPLSPSPIPHPPFLILLSSFHFQSPVLFSSSIL